MAVGGIGYQGIESLKTTTETKKDNQSLDMEDFLNLMVAQLANQDMYNTVDSTQYMAQLAQFTTIQSLSEMKDAMDNLNEISLSTYSLSMIGKEVAIAEIDDDGNLDKITGTVAGVTYFEGQTMVMVNGKKYSLGQIMEVREPGKVIDPPPGDGGEGGDDDGDKDKAPEV